jgi:predicted peptidase
MVLCSAHGATPGSPLPSSSPWVERIFFDDASRAEIRYLVYLPTGHERRDASWPVILFLHGDGERGDDLALVKREGLPRILERNRDFRFVVVAPQLRRKEKWSADRLDRLLDHAIGTYPVDPRRVYITGLSSGAVTSLELAALNPDRLAAVAAVSPNREPREACRAAGVPVWLFHNAFDERVPARVSRRLARALEDCGGEVRLTIYPQSGHDAWSDTYVRADLYEWFLQHPSARVTGPTTKPPGL